jgi:glutaredoxin
MEETRWEGQNLSEVVAPQEEEEEEEEEEEKKKKKKNTPLPDIFLLDINRRTDHRHSETLDTFS